MDVEVQTQQNTNAISDLTNTVTRLATIVELTEKQRNDERQDMRNVVTELKMMSDKIGSMSVMAEKMGNLVGEVGKLRHDIKNLENAWQAIPLLKDALVKNEKATSDHETRINALEALKDAAMGATGIAKIIIHGIWAFASAGGISAIVWIVMKFHGGNISGE